jgi:putative transposase
VGLNRSTFYYRPAGESDLNLHLMRLIDEQYLKTPFYGWPRMSVFLRQRGYPVNGKRVRRLMQVMDLQAIYPKRRTTIGSAEHVVYPYLLRNVVVARPNQVWSADITYIPMLHGFMYLVAIMDWYSRYVLAWELSNTLDGLFCLTILERALLHAQPEIFNTDQGVQFTSLAFTGRLQETGIRISMDGRGRHWTMCLSSGCGAASSTNTCTCTRLRRLCNWKRAWRATSASTTMSARTRACPTRLPRWSTPRAPLAGTHYRVSLLLAIQWS